MLLCINTYLTGYWKFHIFHNFSDQLVFSTSEKPIHMFGFA